MIKVGADAIFGDGSSFAMREPYLGFVQALNPLWHHGDRGEILIGFIIRSRRMVGADRKTEKSGVSRVRIGRDGIVTVFIEVGEDVWEGSLETISAFLFREALQGLARFKDLAEKKGLAYSQSEYEDLVNLIRGAAGEVR